MKFGTDKGKMSLEELEAWAEYFGDEDVPNDVKELYMRQIKIIKQHMGRNDIPNRKKWFDLGATWARAAKEEPPARVVKEEPSLPEPTNDDISVKDASPTHTAILFIQQALVNEQRIKVGEMTEMLYSTKPEIDIFHWINIVKRTLTAIVEKWPDKFRYENAARKAFPLWHRSKKDKFVPEVEDIYKALNLEYARRPKKGPDTITTKPGHTKSHYEIMNRGVSEIVRSVLYELVREAEPGEKFLYADIFAEIVKLRPDLTDQRLQVGPTISLTVRVFCRIWPHIASPVMTKRGNLCKGLIVTNHDDKIKYAAFDKACQEENNKRWRG